MTHTHPSPPPPPSRHHHPTSLRHPAPPPAATPPSAPTASAAPPSPMTSPSAPPPCPHLAAHRLTSRPLRFLRRCLRVRPLGRPEIRRDAREVPRCVPCPPSAPPPPRLYACLSCAAVFCASHAASHASSASSPGHQIAVDVDRAELFCAACGDQVYDPDFDHAVVLAQSTALHPPQSTSTSTSTSLPTSSPAAPRKRRRVDYRAWAPDPAESALVADPPTTSACASAAEPAGLRGLNNLGNTCFMNSVLQALLHAPPLRNYFLADRHNRFLCPRRTPMRHRAADAEAKAKAACLACDLDEIYSATFSGDRTPYSPAKFLYSWWQHATNLASYEQQDAHEFFISILDHIHENIKDDQHKSHEQGHGDCCIAHRVFSGILRSDVICTNCGFSSTTFEPCMDFSLDLDAGCNISVGAANPKARNGERNSGGMNSKVSSTLMRCLERFTRAERLDAEHKFFCERCKERQESLKQMSIRRLPLVSCFHIKRFEHSSIKKMSRKVDHSLQFPFSLDMAPYLSSSILRSRYGNRIFPSEAIDSEAVSEVSSEFEIFAVITHSGKLDSGHYVTYLRLNNHWYRCDDAWVTSVDEQTVRTSQAYMLFYVQKTLYYKACERAAAV